jgi:hypothetical protein
MMAQHQALRKSTIALPNSGFVTELMWVPGTGM